MQQHQVINHVEHVAVGLMDGKEDTCTRPLREFLENLEDLHSIVTIKSGSHFIEKDQAPGDQCQDGVELTK